MRCRLRPAVGREQSVIAVVASRNGLCTSTPIWVISVLEMEGIASQCLAMRKHCPPFGLRPMRRDAVPGAWDEGEVTRCFSQHSSSRRRLSMGAQWRLARPRWPSMPARSPAAQSSCVARDCTVICLPRLRPSCASLSSHFMNRARGAIARPDRSHQCSIAAGALCRSLRWLFPSTY